MFAGDAAPTPRTWRRERGADRGLPMNSTSDDWPSRRGRTERPGITGEGGAKALPRSQVSGVGHRKRAGRNRPRQLVVIRAART